MNETNELDNPSKLNQAPATTQEAMAAINSTEIEHEDDRKRKFVIAELTKLEREAWNHELDAEYTEAIGIPPVQQLINQNNIAIARHQEIIDEINRSGSHTREDRDRRKASEEDIKLLEKENAKRNEFKNQLQRAADGRRGQATETRLHMKFLAEKHAPLFKKD